ncbi:MAG TPA: hypothetical protein VF820_06825 [Patescibacteria group bacterium]
MATQSAIQTISNIPGSATIARGERILEKGILPIGLLKAYEDGLYEAIQRYEIPPTAYFDYQEYAPNEQVIGTTIALLDRLQIPPQLLQRPEAALFALAVGNAWLIAHTEYIRTGHTTQNELLAEEQSLISILQAISTGIKDTTLPVIGEPAGPSQSLFVQPPPSQRIRIQEDQVMSIQACIDAFTDTSRSLEWEHKAKDRGPYGLVHHQYLFLLGQDISQFQIRSLRIRGEELATRTNGGFAWFTVDRSGLPTIVLPNDADNSTAQHELGHLFFPRLSTGNPRLLFAAIDEAWVEYTVDHPAAYTEQRNVLKILLEDPQVALSLATFYRTGLPEHRERFFSNIVKKFGLQGFLQIARMNTLDVYTAYGLATDPSAVEQFLRLAEYAPATNMMSRRLMHTRGFTEANVQSVPTPISEDERFAADYLHYLQSRNL